MGTDFVFEDLRPENLPVASLRASGSPRRSDGDDVFVIEATPATEREAADNG